MSTIVVGPLNCENQNVEGFAVHAAIGPYSMLMLSGDSMDIRIFATADEVVPDQNAVEHYLAMYYGLKKPIGIRLASATMDDNTEKWIIRIRITTPEAMPASHQFGATQVAEIPYYFVVIDTDKAKRLAPALYSMSQQAMAVASEMADIVAGGRGAIDWTVIKMTDYSAG